MKEPLEYYKSKLCRNKVYIKRTEQRSSMGSEEKYWGCFFVS